MKAKIFGITALLVVLCLFMSFMVPGSFLKANNIENLLQRTAMYGILGIGVAFVIITSGIDLSIGSLVCLSGVMLGLLLQVEYAPPESVPVVKLEARAQRVVLRGTIDAIAPGDVLRFFGGRRTALLTVTRVEPRGGATPTTVVHFKESPFRDERQGFVTRLVRIRKIERRKDSQTTRLLVAAPPGLLAPRDRLVLLKPGSLQSFTVRRVENARDDLWVTVGAVVGPQIDTTWFGLPQRRRQRMSVPGALALVLLAGILLGLLHGFLVTKMRLQPFVVTLCGLLIYRGLARWLSDDQPQGFIEYSETLGRVAQGKLVLYQGAAGEFGIPYVFFIMLAVALAAAFLLNQTIWGRYMLALGRNEPGARYSGINTDRVTILAYVICALLSVVGGLLFALDANSVSPSSFGAWYELYAIAAAVLGGCSLRGGEGGIVGVVIGTAVMQLLKNLIVLLKIQDSLELAIIGAVILVGVVGDEFLRRATQRRSR